MSATNALGMTSLVSQAVDASTSEEATQQGKKEQRTLRGNRSREDAAPEVLEGPQKSRKRRATRPAENGLPPVHIGGAGTDNAWHSMHIAGLCCYQAGACMALDFWTLCMDSCSCSLLNVIVLIHVQVALTW